MNKSPIYLVLIRRSPLSCITTRNPHCQQPLRCHCGLCTQCVTGHREEKHCAPKPLQSPLCRAVSLWKELGTYSETPRANAGHFTGADASVVQRARPAGSVRAKTEGGIKVKCKLGLYPGSSGPRGSGLGSLGLRGVCSMASEPACDPLRSPFFPTSYIREATSRVKRVCTLNYGSSPGTKSKCCYQAINKQSEDLNTTNWKCGDWNYLK